MGFQWDNLIQMGEFSAVSLPEGFFHMFRCLHFIPFPIPIWASRAWRLSLKTQKICPSSLGCYFENSYRTSKSCCDKICLFSGTFEMALNQLNHIESKKDHVWPCSSRAHVHSLVMRLRSFRWHGDSKIANGQCRYPVGTDIQRRIARDTLHHSRK